MSHLCRSGHGAGNKFIPGFGRAIFIHQPNEHRKKPAPNVIAHFDGLMKATNQNLATIHRYKRRGRLLLKKQRHMPVHCNYVEGEFEIILQRLKAKVNRISRKLKLFHRRSQSIIQGEQPVYSNINSTMEHLVEDELANTSMLLEWMNTNRTDPEARKTFLWQVLSMKLRSEKKVVICVATSGIAALLMTGGRTAHSRFHIPIDVDSTSTCHIEQDSELAELIHHTSLIIWDEAPMAHKHCIESLDRTLRDVASRSDKTNGDLPFGGITIVFGGDFRQTLPIISKGSRTEIVNSSIKRSKLWDFMNVIQLTENMRLKQVGCTTTEADDIASFSNWILGIGNGVDTSAYGDAEIKIPRELMVPVEKDSIADIVQATYTTLSDNHGDYGYFAKRAILAPFHEIVSQINSFMLDQFPGEEMCYYSSDTIQSDRVQASALEPEFPTEFLNSLDIGNFPAHELKLKVGVPVILLRNLDQTAAIAMRFNSIDEVVTTQPKKWSLQVRVSRSWLAKPHYSDYVHHKDFIFLDEKGHEIWAQIPNTLIPKFNNLLEDQKVYTIQNFKVIPAPNDYRPIANNFVIQFSPSTTVEETTDISSIPQYSFSFITEAEVISKCGDRKLLSGQRGLYATSATKFYGNLQIPQVSNFMSSHVGEVVAPILDDPAAIIKSHVVTIAELNSLIKDAANKHKFFLVDCTIKGVRNGWCYMGCQACAKKVVNAVPDYFCCKKARTETSPRYRIQLEVCDDTDESDFVLLDHLAESILGLTAKKLYELNGNETEIPPVLVMNLMDKSMKIQVQVNEYNIRTARNEFTITKILDAPKAIQSPTSSVLTYTTHLFLH
ncbi:hypothetical protein LINPERHAP2_LOCUS3077, partial [Linum perenne]